MFIHCTVLAMRGKSFDWMVGGLIPIAYILGGIKINV